MRIVIEATRFTAIMLVFGCLFKLLNAIAGSYAEISTLDTWGSVLIIISIPLFILEAVCYASKR